MHNCTGRNTVVPSLVRVLEIITYKTKMNRTEGKTVPSNAAFHPYILLLETSEIIST